MTLNVLADEYTDSQTGSPADNYGFFPKWSYRQGLVLNIIEQAQPDILALQEDSKHQRDGLNHSLTKDYDVAVFSKPQTVTYGGEPSLGTIFYRRSIFEKIESGYFLVAGSRNATWVKLLEKKSQEEWLIVNVHLFGGMTEQQLRKIDLATQDLALNRNVVILGDFNSTPDDLGYLSSELALTSDQGLNRSIFWASNQGQAKKSGQQSSSVGIDHIFSNREVVSPTATYWYSILEDSHSNDSFYPYQSDHGAVMMELPSSTKRAKLAALLPVIQLLLSD